MFIRNLHIIQDSRERLGGKVESWQGFWCWILMKLTQKLLKYDPYHMKPPPGSSGTSTSLKTPGRDLEDRWSLDRVCDVESWWNFLSSFWMMIPIIWHILQDSRERLEGQVESWQGFYCWILMKLSQKLLKYDPYNLTPPSGSSGTSISSKTPGRNLEDRWSFDGFLMLDLDENLTWSHLLVHIEQACPFKDSTKTPDDSRKINGEKVESKRVMSFT